MATTPRWGLPYPIGTDRVMDGDNAIQSLAERVDALTWRVIGLSQVTAAQVGIAAGETQLAGFTVVTPALPAGHRFRITLYVVLTQVGAAARQDVFLQQDAARIQGGLADAVAGGFRIFHVAVIVAPPAGIHTYSASAATTAGTAQTNVAPTQPAWLMVEDLGSIA